MPNVNDSSNLVVTLGYKLSTEVVLDVDVDVVVVAVVVSFLRKLRRIESDCRLTKNPTIHIMTPIRKWLDV